jgi:hypothetical protein
MQRPEEEVSELTEVMGDHLPNLDTMRRDLEEAANRTKAVYPSADPNEPIDLSKTPEFALEMIGPEPDGLYNKYRVFREPENVEEHPTDLEAIYQDSDGATRFSEEVREFVFVLKPDSDRHARIAIAAYAESVDLEKPQLAEDLREILRVL